jgi:hypothetical protein
MELSMAKKQLDPAVFSTEFSALHRRVLDVLGDDIPVEFVLSPEFDAACRRILGDDIPSVTMFTPKFSAACGRILGDDRLATIWQAMETLDARMLEVLALAVRDPNLWFVSALDENGVLRAQAEGETEEEALQKAHRAASEYRTSTQYDIAPLSDWRFPSYPPWN